jgi:putative salt-induced outer membrane protein YdiY
MASIIPSPGLRPPGLRGRPEGHRLDKESGPCYVCRTHGGKDTHTGGLMRKTWGCVFLFALLLLPAGVLADEVRLQNGDVLTGTVLRTEDGVLLVRTDYAAKPVRVKMDRIAGLSTEEAVELHLLSGEVLKGRLRTDQEGRIHVEPSAAREAAVIRWQEVQEVNPPPSKWTGNIHFGGNYQTGNTELLNASFGAQAARQSKTDRFSMRFLYNYAEEDGDLTARNAYGALKYDYFFTKKLYGFLSLEMLNDTFKDINLRTAVGPGAGYQLREDDLDLALELGVTYFSEDRQRAPDDRWFTGRVSAILGWLITQSIRFEDVLIVYPEFQELGEFQLRNDASVNTTLFANWSLRLGNILQYDSSPGSPGVKKTDSTWVLALQYNF